MSLSREDLLSVLRDASRAGYLGMGGSGGNTSNAQREVGGGSSGGFTILGDAATKLGSIIGTSGSELYSTFKKVSDQNYTIADAGKSLNNVLGEFGGLGRAAGAVFGDMADYGHKTVEAWRDVSNFGASFGNDAIGMRAGAAQTRMSFEEYNEFLKKNKDNLVGLGGSITEGARAFNKFSMEFHDTDAADKLRLMGMRTEEVNEVLATNMQSNRLLNLNDAKTRGEVMVASADLAMQMDAVAKLTGKSRKEQEDAAKARAQDIQWQTVDRLLLMDLSKDEQTQRKIALDQMRQSASAMGPEVEGLVKKMASGKAMTKEEQENLAALGPAGAKLQEAVEMSTQAKTKEQKDAAKLAMDAANDAIRAQTMSREHLQASAQIGGGFERMSKSMQAQNNAYDSMFSEEQEINGKKRMLQRGNVEDEKLARELAEKKIKAEQKGEDEKGKKTPGSGTTEAMVLLENRSRDAGAAINRNLVAPLNDKLGDALRGKINEGKIPFLQRNQTQTDRNGNPTGPSARQRADAELQGIVNSFDVNRPDPNNPNTNPRQRDRPNVLPRQGDRSSTESSPFGMVDLFKATTLQVDKMVGPGFAKGTMGVSGNLFENFGSGTLATLHGREAVITEEQMQNLIKGASTGLSAAAESAGTVMGSGGGLSDVALKLDQLNSNILRLIDISHTTAENSGKQIKATKGLGGDLFA